MGLMKKRCFSEGYGLLIKEQLCADSSDCEKRFVCGKMLKNPVWGFHNFDTFGWSFLMVF